MSSHVRDSALPVDQETQKELEPTAPRRSGRVVRQPERYGLLSAEGEAYTAIIDETVDDPTSFKEAMGSSDANLWHGAMDAEITHRTLSLFPLLWPGCLQSTPVNLLPFH